MKRILLLMLLMSVMLTISQTADARRRIRVRKTPAKQTTVIRKSELKEFVPIIFGTDSIVMDSPLLTMEEMGMRSGVMIYVCTLPELKAPSMLTLGDYRDYAQVFVDDEYIGKLDRMKNEKTLKMPPVHDGQELKILVEAIGRSKSDALSTDFVGLADQIVLAADIDGNELTLNLKCWTILTIPDGYDTAIKALAAAQSTDETPQLDTTITPQRPGYYRYNVVFSRSGSIYLNMEDFGRGQVFVNGNPLGYFFDSDSKKSLQVLRRYLKRGFNEVVILGIVGSASVEKTPALKAQNKP